MPQLPQTKNQTDPEPATSACAARRTQTQGGTRGSGHGRGSYGTLVSTRFCVSITLRARVRNTGGHGRLQSHQLVTAYGCWSAGARHKHTHAHTNADQKCRQTSSAHRHAHARTKSASLTSSRALLTPADAEVTDSAVNSARGRGWAGMVVD